MTTISLTGANGFLGWHTRCAAQAQRTAFRAVSVGESFNLDAAVESINGSDRFIHVAGVNRASDDEVREGNQLFAEQVSSALLRAENPPPVVVYANSTHAGNGSIYGTAKSAAADIVGAAANQAGAEFVDVELPNLFGEHGLPFYNSVVATFCHQLAAGAQPFIDQDRELTLLHAQNAAELLLGSCDPLGIGAITVNETVTGLLSRLRGFAAQYTTGEIPDISTTFDRDLFNTYRSYTFPAQSPVRLTRHGDGRGSFFEIIRSHGGSGQSSFSTTVPGISRGDHYHLRKLERFTVLAGEAVISLRKLFTNEVFEFPVTGAVPQSIDMPTMWAHKIVNVGKSDLYTSFWSNDIFDPTHPDTFAETV